jgi:hypothetical protein
VELRRPTETHPAYGLTAILSRRLSDYHVISIYGMIAVALQLQEVLFFPKIFAKNKFPKKLPWIVDV